MRVVTAPRPASLMDYEAAGVTWWVDEFMEGKEALEAARNGPPA